MDANQTTFDWHRHERFAFISGDFNPIHMDRIAARRTHVGAPIVHGIHSLIWALECLAREQPDAGCAVSMKVQFLQPIYVGDTVSLQLSRPTPKSVRLRLAVQSEDVATVTLGLEKPIKPTRRISVSSACSPPPATPQELSLEEMAPLSGAVSFGSSTPQLAELFPTASRVFGAQRLAALACTSTLVGMIVPGLHSMFSGLDVVFCDDAAIPSDQVDFAVASVAPRFRLVRIDIASRNLRGSLETLSRMPPVDQPTSQQVATLVTRDEFRDSTALIVGGSRGLGELTAKLIAAGGARVIITYATGRADAEAVVQDMRRAGLECTAVPYDVQRPAAGQLDGMSAIPTHIYYFATPPIFRRKSGMLDPVRFDEFYAFYVGAFFDLVQACARMRPEGIRVFYPSSAAIDGRPANMTEYTMAKAAGEILCADLTKFVPGVRVLSHRLPRLLTDQTSSVVQSDTVRAIEVVLPIVREMHRR